MLRVTLRYGFSVTLRYATLDYQWDTERARIEIARVTVARLADFPAHIPAAQTNSRRANPLPSAIPTNATTVTPSITSRLTAPTGRPPTP